MPHYSTVYTHSLAIITSLGRANTDMPEIMLEILFSLGIASPDICQSGTSAVIHTVLSL